MGAVNKFQMNAKNMKKQESKLSKDIEDRMLQISRVLPPEMISSFYINNFMKKKGPGALKLIINALVTSKLRQGLDIWSSKVEKIKAAEKATRTDVFNQQGGLRRIKRMLDAAMMERTIRCFGVWLNHTVKLRAIFQTPYTIVIQKYFRRYIRRKCFVEVVNAAKTIQLIWRGVVGRRLYLAARLRRKQNKAAIIIQRNWRVVLGQLAAARMRLSLANSRIGSLTGSIGSASKPGTSGASAIGSLAYEGQKLLEAAMRGELDMKTVKERLAKLEAAVERAKQAAIAAAKVIQRAWRCYVAREVLKRKVLCQASALKIQSFYRMHRAIMFVSVIKTMRQTLIKANRHVAAMKVQKAFEDYRYRLNQQAATTMIISAIRASQQQVAAITIQDAFRKYQVDLMLLEMEHQIQELVEFSVRKMQRVARGFLTRLFVRRMKVQIVAARKIQRKVRGYLGIVEGLRRRSASNLLGAWGREALYQLRLRRLRRRVYHRWGRKRYKTLSRAFMGWPGWTEVATRRSKLIKSVKADMHYKKTTKCKYWRRCADFLHLCREEKRKLNQAIKLWELATYRRIYVTWHSNVLDILEFKAKLKFAVQWWKNKEYAAGFGKFAAYRLWRIRRREQKEIARRHLVKQRKRNTLIWLSKCVASRKKQLMDAMAWFLSSHTRNSFRKLKLYVAWRRKHRAQILEGENHFQEAFFHYGKIHAVNKWLKWLEEEKQMRARLTKALAYWRKAQMGRLFRQWTVFKNETKAEKDRQKLAIQYYKKHFGGGAIQYWDTWAKAQADWRRRLFRDTKKAVAFFRKRKFAMPFFTWKEFWRIVTEERRIMKNKMSIEIQRVWRGHRGRKWAHQRRKILAMLRKHVVENEEEVELADADTFREMQLEKEWVLVMFFAEFATFDNPNYTLMKSAVAGAAIDLKRLSWPQVFTVKADALSKFTRVCNPAMRVTSTLGHAEKIPPDLPYIRLYWKGNPKLHNCPPLQFDFDIEEHKVKAKALEEENSRSTEKDELRTPMEIVLYEWVQKHLKNTIKNIYQPNAATDIQRVFRSLYGKQRMRNRRAMLRRVASAIQIQTQYRAHARRIAAYWGRQFIIKRELNALKIIQRSYRGYIGRDFVGVLLEKKRCTIGNFPHSFVCSECKTEVGVIMCHDCDAPFCEKCFLAIHDGASERSFHESSPIDYKAFNNHALMCGQCEVAMARVFCEDCQDAYCNKHMKLHHSKGNRRLHARHLFLTRETSEFLRIEKKVKDPEKIKELKLLRQKFIDEHRLAKCDLHNWKTPARIAWEQTEEGKRKLAEEQAARRKQFLMEKHREEVRRIFDTFDLDKSGTIDSNELYNMLVNEMCIPLKKKDVKQIAKELDQNDNGIIDFEEFLEWYVIEIIEEGKLEGVSLSRARLKMRKNMNKMKDGIDTWYKEKFPYKRPKVKGGWDAFLIREDVPEDVKEVRPIFWWWVREEFGLAKEIGDVDEYREFTEDELDAFKTAFLPQWNGGRLKVRFYHDGRRFYHKKKFWVQHWDSEKEKFFWVEEESGRKTYLNPDPTPGEIIARNAMSGKEKAKETLEDLKVKAIENGKWLARNGVKYSKIYAKKGYHKFQQRGMDEREKKLYKMGFSREVAIKSAELAPRDFEEAVQQAHYFQVLEEKKQEERKRYLEENPPLVKQVGNGVKQAFTTLWQWWKGADPLTEEEKRARAIDMMRRQMYGDNGGLGTDSEVETSDEEKYLMSFD
jgi:hypothetical protein